MKRVPSSTKSTRLVIGETRGQEGMEEMVFTPLVASSFLTRTALQAETRHP